MPNGIQPDGSPQPPPLTNEDYTQFDAPLLRWYADWLRNCCEELSRLASPLEEETPAPLLPTELHIIPVVADELPRMERPPAPPLPPKRPLSQESRTILSELSQNLRETPPQTLGGLLWVADSFCKRLQASFRRKGSNWAWRVMWGLGKEAAPAPSLLDSWEIGLIKSVNLFSLQENTHISLHEILCREFVKRFLLPDPLVLGAFTSQGWQYTEGLCRLFHGSEGLLPEDTRPKASPTDRLRFWWELRTGLETCVRQKTQAEMEKVAVALLGQDKWLAFVNSEKSVDTLAESTSQKKQPRFKNSGEAVATLYGSFFWRAYLRPASKPPKNPQAPPPIKPSSERSKKPNPPEQGPPLSEPPPPEKKDARARRAWLDHLRESVLRLPPEGNQHLQRMLEKKRNGFQEGTKKRSIWNRRLSIVRNLCPDPKGRTDSPERTNHAQKWSPQEWSREITALGLFLFFQSFETSFWEEFHEVGPSRMLAKCALRSFGQRFPPPTDETILKDARGRASEDADKTPSDRQGIPWFSMFAALQATLKGYFAPPEGGTRPSLEEREARRPLW